MESNLIRGEKKCRNNDKPQGGKCLWVIAPESYECIHEALIFLSIKLYEKCVYASFIHVLYNFQNTEPETENML